MSRRSLSPILLIALLVAHPRAASAQSPSDTSASSASPHRPTAVWLSVGLGPGSKVGHNDTEISAVFRANVSTGPLLFTYRSSDISPGDFGDGVRDDALLAGLRTGGHRLFAAAALGYARAAPYHECNCGDESSPAPRAGGLAYDLTLHANARVPGIALSMSGTAGGARVSYRVFTVALEFGWFGE